jgi:O-antigen/teichoic acid export membrane protein
MRLQTLIYQGIFWRGLYYASVFALNIVIARALQAAESGILNYLINNLSFLLLLTSLSLESALGYFASRNEISSGRLATLGLLLAVVSAALSTGVLFILMYAQDVEGPYGLLFSFMYVLGVVFTNYFGALFYARQRVIFPNAALISINLAVLVFALWRFEFLQGPVGSMVLLKVYFVSFFAQGIIILLAWGLMQSGFRNPGLPAKAEMRRIFHYTFSALLANLIFFLVYRVDYWFVKTFCTDTHLGNYIQVSKLGQIFLLLPSIIATAVFTRTAGGSQEHVRSVIEIISRWLLVMYIILVAVIALTGRWLFPWIYGPSFDQMYITFLLLSPGVLALSTLSLLTAFNAGRNKMAINIRGSFIALVVIVAGNFLLVPRYGIHAAALVSSIGYICFQVYVLDRFRKEYGSGIRQFFLPRMADWNKVKQFVRPHETDKDL